MSYSRQPNVVQAGKGLTQNPPATVVTPPGIIPVTLDADIATTESLGVIQVGSGLSITPEGILSATGSGSSLLNVYLTSTNYTATLNDYYIGGNAKNIMITLPLGITGKVYVVKNQLNGSDDSGGNIKVQGTSGQTLDRSSFKTLGSNASLIALFDGSRWNLV